MTPCQTVPDLQDWRRFRQGNWEQRGSASKSFLGTWAGAAPVLSSSELNAVLPGRRFNLQNAITSPGTKHLGLDVYWLQNGRSSGLVWKMHRGDAAVFVGEVAAHAFLRDHHIAVASLRLYGKTLSSGSPSYHTVYEVAGQSNLQQLADRCFSRGGISRQTHRAFATAGGLLAQLHALAPAAPDCQDAMDTRAAHVAYVRRLLGNDGLLARAVTRGFLSVSQANLWAPRIDAIAGEASAAPIEQLPLGVAHNDCCPQNFVFDHRTEKVSFVDIGLVLRSVTVQAGDVAGTTDRRLDLGRFCEKLAYESARKSDSQTISHELWQTFLVGYFADSAIDHPLKRPLPVFFLLRLLVVALAALLNKDPAEVCQKEIHAVQRRFGALLRIDSALAMSGIDPVR